jgi:hypothetical protein
MASAGVAPADLILLPPIDRVATQSFEALTIVRSQSKVLCTLQSDPGARALGYVAVNPGSDSYTVFLARAEILYAQRASA